MILFYDPAISFLGLYPKETIQIGKGPTYKKLFIASLFVVAQNRKSRGHPSNEEWLNKLQYMNIMEFYCAIRYDEVKFPGLSHVLHWSPSDTARRVLPVNL